VYLVVGCVVFLVVYCCVVGGVGNVVCVSGVT
jgi:hypothetical protein